MVFTRFFIIIILFFLPSCALIMPSGHSVYIANGVKLNFISSDSLKKSQTLNQLLKADYKQKHYEMNLVTQFSPDSLKIIGLTKFGARIFTIDYNNKKLHFWVSPVVEEAKKIRPEYIFGDIQLVYWPLAAIKNSLEGDISVKETGGKRVFYKNGKPIIEISYNNKDKWKSSIHYNHLERKYEYTIENL